MPRTPASDHDLDRQLDAIRRGEHRAIGRAITAVLEDDAAGERLRSRLAGDLGRAQRVGVTGPPGVGKSTLIAALAKRLVEDGERVGVIATDPRSPRSGGAFLGDRVRLAAFRLAAEPRIFFRSLAGALDEHRARQDPARAADVLDAAGFPTVFLETIGAGQAELGIRLLCGTLVLVLHPDAGDEIQLLKAGVLEVADVYVVNRGDRPGAEKCRALLEERVHAAPAAGCAWVAPVVVSEASRSVGVDGVLDAIRRHRQWSRDASAAAFAGSAPSSAAPRIKE